MTEYPKISIIIPIYKTETYIRKCIDSIVKQTYSNIEVLLVDDGSPDKCGEICDSYADKYPYIKVIHQQNQGQAAARNNAVLIAAGEFIVFVDSDDYISRDCIEYLVKLQQKYNADVAIGGCEYIYEGKKPPVRTDSSKEYVWSAEDALIYMNYLTKGFGATPWAKIYKRELILKHPFPVGQIYEDLATLYKIIGDSEIIAFGSKRIYYWVQREGSTMRMAFDDRQLAGITAAADQIKYIEKRYPRALPAAKARYMGKIIEIMPLALKCSESRSIYKKLKKQMIYFREVMVDPNVKKSHKVRLFFARLGYIPAKIVFSIHEKVKRKKLS